jgi:hypothetical protein
MRYLTRSLAFALLLLATLAPAQRAAGVQTADGTPPSPPKNLTLAFELQDLPGIEEAGSYWEVSYQWRIADRQEFNRWSGAGEDPATLSGFGMLLSSQSFKLSKLSESRNRRFEVSVPVKDRLLEQLSEPDRRPQVVWLHAIVRIHDSKLGTDVIRKVNPAWGPNFYREGVSRVRIELLPDIKLRWSTSATPPWVAGQKRTVIRPNRIP